MSWTQRYLPILVASTIGVVSGYYIFDPALRQSAKDLNLNPPPSPVEQVKEAVTPNHSDDAKSNSNSISAKIDQAGEKIAKAAQEADSPVALKAREQAAMAKANAGKRAADAVREISEKTGEGKIV